MNNIKVIEQRRDALRAALNQLIVEQQAANTEILQASPERLQAIAVERIQLDAKHAATMNALQQVERDLQTAQAQLDTKEYKQLKKQTVTAGQAFAEAAQAARDAMQAAIMALQTAQEKQTAYKALVKQDVALSPEEQSIVIRNADARSITQIANRLTPYAADVKYSEGMRTYRQDIRKPARVNPSRNGYEKRTGEDASRWT